MYYKIVLSRHSSSRKDVLYVSAVTSPFVRGKDVHRYLWQRQAWSSMIFFQMHNFFQTHKYCGNSNTWYILLYKSIWSIEKCIFQFSNHCLYYCIKISFMFTRYTITENEMTTLLRGQHIYCDYKRLWGFQAKIWFLKLYNKLRLCLHPWQISSSQKWLV